MNTTQRPSVILVTALAAALLLALAAPTVAQTIPPQQACIRAGGTWTDQKVCIVPGNGMLKAPASPVPAVRTGPGKGYAARAANDGASKPPVKRPDFDYRCLDFEKTITPVDTVPEVELKPALLPCKAL